MASYDYINLLCISQPSTNPIFRGFGIKKVQSEEVRQIKYIHLHSQPVRDLAFHPEQQDAIVASASMDKSLKLTSLLVDQVCSMVSYVITIAVYSALDRDSSLFCMPRFIVAFLEIVSCIAFQRLEEWGIKLLNLLGDLSSLELISVDGYLGRVPESHWLGLCHFGSFNDQLALRFLHSILNFRQPNLQPASPPPFLIRISVRFYFHLATKL